MKRLRVMQSGAVLLWACLALAGCSKDKDIDKPALLMSFTPTLKVDRLWTAKVNDRKGAKLRLGLGLAVDGSRVYAADHKGGVTAFELDTGRQLWRVRLKAPLSGGVGASGDLLAVGSTRGELFALNSSNGSILWKVRLNGEVLSAPALSERLIAVRTVDGKLHGLAPKDGHELWSQSQQVPRLSLRGTGSPVLVGDLALCGFDNGKVVAVNVNDGSVQWEATVAPPHGRTELERLADIDGTVDVTGKDVYAVGFQGRVAMLALDTGQIWWSHEASSYRSLGLDEGALYMASSDGDVVALQKRTGAELWRQKALAHRRLSAVAAADAALVAADFQGYVHWFDKSSGALAARVATAKVRISNPPIVVGNRVLVINDAGNIWAFKVSPMAGARSAKGAPPAPAAQATATPGDTVPPDAPLDPAASAPVPAR